MKHFLMRTERLRAMKGNTVLFSDVWLNAVAGEVTGVIGLDAEGKSALTAILSGRREADGGTLFLHGERLCPRQAADRLRQAVCYVGPEDVLSDHLSLADNLFVLGQKRPDRGPFRWIVNDAENRQRALEYLSLAQLERSPNTPVGQLTADERHRIEFLRALIRGTPLIVFNTPLKRAELVANEPAFRALLNHARSCGIGIVMMFNNVDRLMRLCDRAAIVRGGRTVCLCEKQDFDRSHLLQLLHGSYPSMPVPHAAASAAQKTVLALQNAVTADGNLDGFSCRIHSGEIVGIVCADDEWNGWFADLLQGKHPLLRGQILRHDVPVASEDLLHPLNKTSRAFFVIGSENLGLLQHMNALDNLLLPIQDRVGGLLHWIGNDVQNHMLHLCMEGGIVSNPADALLPVESLSTEQKLRIWMARARLCHPDLCVFLGIQEENDPVLRELIHCFAKELAASGTAVLMLSTQKYPMSEAASRLLIVENGKVSHTIQSESPLFQ